MLQCEVHINLPGSMFAALLIRPTVFPVSNKTFTSLNSMDITGNEGIVHENHISSILVMVQIISPAIRKPKENCELVSIRQQEINK